MMISNNQIQGLLKAYGPQNNKQAIQKQPVKPATTPGPDQMKVSSEAMFFSTLNKAMGEVSELRESKVQALQETIRSGNYNPSGEDIAEKMLGRSLIDSLL